MSAYFNQTNIAPGTSFANPGNNFSAGINLNGITLLGGGAGQSTVLQPTSELFMGDGVGQSANYGISSIKMATPAGGLTSVMNFNIGGISSIQLTNLSSLQAGAYTVNAPRLLSTIVGNGWA